MAIMHLTLSSYQILTENRYLRKAYILSLPQTKPVNFWMHGDFISGIISDRVGGIVCLKMKERRVERIFLTKKGVTGCRVYDLLSLVAKEHFF